MAVKDNLAVVGAPFHGPAGVAEAGAAYVYGVAIDCNSDGTSDLCETDSDGDGVIDDCDNCPDDSNPLQEDADVDGIGDACETECVRDRGCDDGNDCTADECVGGRCSL